MAVSEQFLKADPLQLIGLGLIGLAVPIFFPALRPPLAALLKAGAKLALEAEFDADDALADGLANTAINALLRVSPRDSEKDLYDRSEAAVNRFLAAASASAARRGWDQQDVATAIASASPSSTMPFRASIRGRGPGSARLSSMRRNCSENTMLCRSAASRTRLEEVLFIREQRPIRRATMCNRRGWEHALKHLRAKEPFRR